MPTTFNVLYLGVQADIDTVEGNNNAEGAAALVGLTIGSVTDPLWEQIQSLSPGSTGFAGGTNNAYDMDNIPSETFTIDGGADQVFDGTAIYNATITYTDGTTAGITAVIFQDSAGNTYLAPEFSPNGDQTALEAKPIQSLTLDSVNRNTNLSGLSGDRQLSAFMVCFAEGTLLATPSGQTPVEKLAVGDTVDTLDHGAQKIRWIGSRTVAVIEATRPVQIEAGALGNGLPQQDLWVSPQHRILANSIVAARMFNQPDVLVAAKKLVGLPGISLAPKLGLITYWHILCDRHEIVLANGAPAETLLLGDEARVGLGDEVIENIFATCPDMAQRFGLSASARHIPTPRQQKKFAARLGKNGKPVIAAGFVSTPREAFELAS
ncbi:Hint domain-containing protein [Arenibacterium sp. CAU 1754]